MRNIKALVLTLGLMAGLLAFAGAANATTYSASTYASSTHTKVNHERIIRHRTALKSNYCLRMAATRQAKAMAARHKMYHQSLKPLLKNCHMNYVGENVAMGFSEPTSLVRAWMNSSGHRANILNSKYRYSGLAAVKDSRGRWYVSQVFGRHK